MQQSIEEYEQAPTSSGGDTPYTFPVARAFALAVGIALTALGICGFVPGLNSGGTVLGIFGVSGGGSLLHLATGLAGLAVWRTRSGVYAVYFALAIGLLYLVVFSIGHIVIDNERSCVASEQYCQNPVSWFMRVTYPTNLLHAALMAGGWGTALVELPRAGKRTSRPGGARP